MINEEKQIEAKLQQLEAQLRRNECLMRKMLINCEEVLSDRGSLFASIQALRNFREARRRNTLKHLHSKQLSQRARALK